MKIVTMSKLFGCSLAVGIAACSPRSNNNPIENVRQAAEAPELQGKNFQGECGLRPLEALASGIATSGEAAVKSARVSYRFTGANMDRSTVLYQSSDCSGDEALKFEATGSFDIVEDQKSDDGGTTISMNYTNLKVTVANEVGANIARETELCGNEDWEAGQSRDVNEHASDANCYRQRIPYTLRTLYKVDGRDLYFGDKGLLALDGEAPDSLDMQTKFTEE